MPRLDGTGPMGQGPMTGRGWGYCGCRRGFGWFGGFRGFGHRWSLADEKKVLDEEEKALEQELAAIREEKKELASKGSK